MVNILISDPYIGQVDADKLELAALTVLLHQEIPPECELSVVIEGDERLHALNKEFLNIDAPTDVLSFPSGAEEIDPETGIIYLGDVIISYPRAAEQAASAGHPVLSELQLLVIHGVLHLLGHDHAEPEEKTVMWDAQDEILLTLGVQLSRLPD
jgi:probable rRNA maturation factor